MCDVCGCGDTTRVSVELHTSLLTRNDQEAAHLRGHFRAQGVVAINLMGSPGSGKTALLEATARAFAGRHRLAAVSGDLATERDAERLRRAGIPAAAITTGTACHLEASMVHHALHGPLGAAVGHADLFFIENVGNLVCPAIYDLGQAANVVVLSVTEGADKPLKYPVMFKNADLVVLTKTDLLPYVDVDLAELRDNLAQVMPRPGCVAVAATRDQGLQPWLEVLEGLLRARGPARRPVDLRPAAPAAELARITLGPARPRV